MKPPVSYHVVVLPYASQSQINAMMNICHQIASRKPPDNKYILVTEEWLSLIGPRQDSFHETIPVLCAIVLGGFFPTQPDLDPWKMKPPVTGYCHVVVLPYPGRSQINAMMNFCHQIASRKPPDNKNILVTFVVTEEWLSLIGPREPTISPDNKNMIHFETIPNVVPSEHDRAKDIYGFVEVVLTRLETPFEELLDRLELPVSAIVADSYLLWAVEAGKRRNIPVASLWNMSASVFSVMYHFELLKQNGHFPVELSEQGHQVVDYIPGISTTRLADLPREVLSTDNVGQKLMKKILGAVSGVSKAQYFLSISVYELESQVFDVLKAKFPFPVYSIGPSIPYLQLESSFASHNICVPDYLKWLDSQPKKSVLYVSFGSFLSVSSAQLDEIIAGIQNSGTRYLWVARGDASKIEECNCGDAGFVVPWCDQLRVLCHTSIGGFWTHCGWNSTLEAVFGGVSILTFPIIWDQVSNSKQIVEDWKIGYKVKKGIMGNETMVTRDEVAEIVKRFMDPENKEGKLMRERAKQLRETCHRAIAKGGSSDTNLDAFIRDISQGHGS